MKSIYAFNDQNYFASFPFCNAENIVFNLTSILKQTRDNQRFLVRIARLLLCMLQYNISSAQTDASGVWQYNAELEGHHCDDAGCHTNCTSSYMGNSVSANNSEPSSTLMSVVARWIGKIKDPTKKLMCIRYLAHMIPGSNGEVIFLKLRVGILISSWKGVVSF